MKIFLFLFLLSAHISIAQAQKSTVSSEHLTFKEVPIDGTLDEFVANMKKHGFTDAEKFLGITILEGDFASYKKCMLAVATLKKRDLVYKILVVFPDRTKWSVLSANYFNLKEMLTEKYGTPSESIEKFESAIPDNDRDKILAVQQNECKYKTTYETPKGNIELSIDHERDSRCFVSLRYMDKINSEIIKKIL